VHGPVRPPPPHEPVREWGVAPPPQSPWEVVPWRSPYTRLHAAYNAPTFAPASYNRTRALALHPCVRSTMDLSPAVSRHLPLSPARLRHPSLIPPWTFVVGGAWLLFPCGACGGYTYELGGVAPCPCVAPFSHRAMRMWAVCVGVFVHAAHSIAAVHVPRATRL
jgi:hypothetical protein